MNVLVTEMNKTILVRINENVFGFSCLPDLAWEAGVWWWLLPLLVDPGLSGVWRGGEPNSDRWYEGVNPPRPGGNHISSSGTLPLDSTSPGVDWLRPIAAKINYRELIYWKFKNSFQT